MTTRRTVLKAGVSLPLVWGLNHAAFADSSRPWTAIVDERFAPAAAFARQARLQGADVLGFRADAGSVWMRHLSDRTDARTRRFVGLTSEAGLFGLDVMLRGHNMRLVYLAEHRPVDGAYVHSVRLPQRASWGAEAATLAMRVPAGGYRPLPAALGPSLQEAAPEQLTLVSWVIAA